MLGKLKLFPALIFSGLSLLPARTCVPAARLWPADTAQGALQERSCRSPGGAFVAEYALVLPTRGQLRLEAASAAFEPLVFLRDQAGHKLASGAALSLAMEAGSYTVLVTSPSAGQTGDFTLRSAFTPEPGTWCVAFPSIGLNQAITARLSDASCRLPDGSAYDAYHLATLGPGTLEIAMESEEARPLLLVRDDTERLLASSEIEGNVARASLAVTGDQNYKIVATVLEGGQGRYKLSVAFRPGEGERCRAAKALDGSQAVDGRVEAGACTMALPVTGDPGPFHYFDVLIAERGSAEFRVTATGFEPLLSLLDASGDPVALDVQGGGPGISILRQQFEPGRYTLLVVSLRRFGGDYRLDYVFRPGPPEVCPVLSLPRDQVMPGSLAGSSTCRTADGLGDEYRIEIAQSGTLDVGMASEEFDAFLVLQDEFGNRLVADDNGGGDPDARITAVLPAGVYLVAAGTSGGVGRYAVAWTHRPGEIPTCARVQQMAVNSAYLGFLGNASCRGANGQPVDYYEFTAPAEGTAAAVMTAAELDSYLTLADSAGTVLRRDDNSYGGADAILVQFLPGHTYRLGVRAAESNLGGLYRLDLLFAAGERPAGCTPMRKLASGESFEALLYITSCQYPAGTFADLYRLEITEAAAVRLELASRDFDAVLQLLDAKGNLLDENDDGAGGTDARIERALDPGVYVVVARPIAEYSSLGTYRLTLSSR